MVNPDKWNVKKYISNCLFFMFYSGVLVGGSYYTFIVYFVYLQLSVTVSLLLVFCPKVSV